MKALLDKIKSIEHGFKHTIEAGDIIMADNSVNHLDSAMQLLKDESYQVRMLATYLLGQLSANNEKALKILETKVATDGNWRVQEMLAKAFDHYCQCIGYEQSLPTIKRWITDKNPNIKRAVIEGLRIWTSKPYFKEHPEVAIQLIAKSKSEESEYLRKSIGNSLRDIRKKHKELVDAEVSKWDLTDKKILFIRKLIFK